MHSLIARWILDFHKQTYFLFVTPGIIFGSKELVKNFSSISAASWTF